MPTDTLLREKLALYNNLDTGPPGSTRSVPIIGAHAPDIRGDLLWAVLPSPETSCLKVGRMVGLSKMRPLYVSRVFRRTPSSSTLSVPPSSREVITSA